MFLCFYIYSNTQVYSQMCVCLFIRFKVYKYKNSIAKLNNKKIYRNIVVPVSHQKNS